MDMFGINTPPSSSYQLDVNGGIRGSFSVHIIIIILIRAYVFQT